MPKHKTTFDARAREQQIMQNRHEEEFRLKMKNAYGHPGARVWSIDG